MQNKFSKNIMRRVTKGVNPIDVQFGLQACQLLKKYEKSAVQLGMRKS
jgi:hypothetical protein